MIMFDVRIDNVSMQEAIEKVIELGKKGNKDYVVTPNVDHIVMLQTDEHFKKVYEEASLVIADGMPLIWASKLLKKSLKEKVSGSDLFSQFAPIAAKEGLKLFFLGAMEGVAAKAADILTENNPGLQVVGTYSPPFGFQDNSEENQKIIDMINDSGADILFVGVGAPKQENWIYANRDKLNVKVSLGVGASFDFVAGSVKRAPVWMQESGLEWFYRLIKEPKRMWKRYIVQDSVFVWLFIKELLKK